MAIAFFYAVGTGLGGIIGPVLFGRLVGTGHVSAVAVGYYIGAALMIGAGLVEAFIGVEAAQRPLEDIAEPLSSTDGTQHEEKQPERSPATTTRATRPSRLWSPYMSHSSWQAHADPYLDPEVDALLLALDDGALSKSALHERLHAERSGPGRYALVLRTARGQGPGSGNQPRPLRAGGFEIHPVRPSVGVRVKETRMPQHEDHSPLVLREGHGHVAEIVLHRPHALNALSTQLMVELREVCEAVGADPDVRAVVLSGSGSRAFCVGADLKERNGFSEQDLLAQRPVFQAGFAAVRALPVPVVAAVHGYRPGRRPRAGAVVRPDRRGRPRHRRTARGHASVSCPEAEAPSC